MAKKNSHNSHDLISWLTLVGLVLTISGSLSVSAYAQTEAQQTGQEQTRHTSARSRIAEKAIASLRLFEADPAVSTKETVEPLTSPVLLPPPTHWAGAYVGGHFGYGWGKANTSFTPLPTAAAFVNLAPTTLRPNPTGVHGGAQIGYNWQSGG